MKKLSKQDEWLAGIKAITDLCARTKASDNLKTFMLLEYLVAFKERQKKRSEHKGRSGRRKSRARL